MYYIYTIFISMFIAFLQNKFSNVIKNMDLIKEFDPNFKKN